MLVLFHTTHVMVFLIALLSFIFIVLAFSAISLFIPLFFFLVLLSIVGAVPQLVMSSVDLAAPFPAIYSYITMGLFPCAYAYGHSALLAFELPDAPGVVEPGLTWDRFK